MARSRESAYAAGWDEDGTPRTKRRPARPDAVKNALLGRAHEHFEVELRPVLDRREQAATLRWLDRRTLWRSRNDKIGSLYKQQIAEERSRWVDRTRSARLHGPAGDLVIGAEHLDEFSLCIAGDPGDGDASQFAVARALVEEAHSTQFLVLLSDVVYPAGDINEYIDKHYLPYEDYEGTIYGVPGNHDWYDGLNGFMFHFCGVEPLARPRYRSSSIPLRARLAQLLFRRASAPRRQLLVASRASRKPWSLAGSGEVKLPVQPGPYFGIDTKHVLFVAIDTGVNGMIDREQADWLLHVASRYDKPKILLTGKPIYVNGEYHPCEIEPLAFAGRGEETPLKCVKRYPSRSGRSHPYCSVDDIVRDPAHNFRAVIGGDVHNYQRYTITLDQGARKIEYIVSGGGGAYLSSTHGVDAVRLWAGTKETGRVRRLLRRLPDKGRTQRDPCEEPGDPAGVDPLIEAEDTLNEGRFRCYPLRGDAVALYTHLARIRLPRFAMFALQVFAFAAVTATFVVADSSLPTGDPWRVRAVVIAVTFFLPFAYVLFGVGRYRVRALAVALAAGALAALLWVMHDNEPYEIAAAWALAGGVVLVLAYLLELAWSWSRPGKRRIGYSIAVVGVVIVMDAVVNALDRWSSVNPLLIVALGFSLAATLGAFIRRSHQADLLALPTRFFVASLVGSGAILANSYVDPPPAVNWTLLVLAIAASFVGVAALLTTNLWVYAAFFVLAALTAGLLWWFDAARATWTAVIVTELGALPLLYLVFSGAFHFAFPRSAEIDANLASAWTADRLRLAPARADARAIDLPDFGWRGWPVLRRWLVSRDQLERIRLIAEFRAVYQLPRASTHGVLKDFSRKRSTSTSRRCFGTSSSSMCRATGCGSCATE